MPGMEKQKTVHFDLFGVDREEENANELIAT